MQIFIYVCLRRLIIARRAFYLRRLSYSVGRCRRELDSSGSILAIFLTFWDHSRELSTAADCDPNLSQDMLYRLPGKHGQPCQGCRAFILRTGWVVVRRSTRLSSLGGPTVIVSAANSSGRRCGRRSRPAARRAAAACPLGLSQTGAGRAYAGDRRVRACAAVRGHRGLKRYPGCARACTVAR